MKGWGCLWVTGYGRLQLVQSGIDGNSLFCFVKFLPAHYGTLTLFYSLSVFLQCFHQRNKESLFLSEKNRKVHLRFHFFCFMPTN